MDDIKEPTSKKNLKKTFYSDPELNALLEEACRLSHLSASYILREGSKQLAKEIIERKGKP